MGVRGGAEGRTSIQPTYTQSVMEQAEHENAIQVKFHMGIIKKVHKFIF